MRRSIKICATFTIAIVLSGATLSAQFRGEGRIPRSSARANVNLNQRRSMNFNHNTNVNRNTNVNVNRDVNINVHNDYHGGRGYYGGGYYGGGCCYHPVATAAAVTATAMVTAAVIGSIVSTIPPSCSSVIVNGLAYQQCGSAWYQPQFSGGAQTYIVVSAPR